MGCSPPDFFVHGILQARLLEWVAMPSSKGSSQPRDWICISCIAGGFFSHWATWESLPKDVEKLKLTYIARGIVKWYKQKMDLHFLKIIGLPHNPAVPFIGIWNIYLQKNLYIKVHSSIIYSQKSINISIIHQLMNEKCQIQTITENIKHKRTHVNVIPFIWNVQNKQICGDRK